MTPSNTCLSRTNDQLNMATDCSANPHGIRNRISLPHRINKGRAIAGPCAEPVPTNRAASAGDTNPSQDHRGNQSAAADAKTHHSNNDSDALRSQHTGPDREALLVAELQIALITHWLSGTVPLQPETVARMLITNTRALLANQ